MRYGLTVSAGKAIGQVAGLASFAVLTRQLGVELFGVLALIRTVAAVTEAYANFNAGSRAASRPGQGGGRGRGHVAAIVCRSAEPAVGAGSRFPGVSFRKQSATYGKSGACSVTADHSGLGITELIWNAPAGVETEIHAGSPGGPLFTAGGNTGRAATEKWVRNGMQVLPAGRHGREASHTGKYAGRGQRRSDAMSEKPEFDALSGAYEELLRDPIR